MWEQKGDVGSQSLVPSLVPGTPGQRQGFRSIGSGSMKSWEEGSPAVLMSFTWHFHCLATDKCVC